MNTVYQHIALSALINWNGLTQEEAMKKIKTESVDELENQIFAKSSIKYAIIGITKVLKLTDEEATLFYEAVINGPTNAKIFDKIKNKFSNITEEQKINILSIIHNGWVKDNSNQKIYDKKIERKQLRQFASLELIGFNEVKSDLLFLKPILESIGVLINEQDLENTYHNKANKYLFNVKTKEDLVILVKYNIENYKYISDDIKQQLLLNINEVTEQILNNWVNKDNKSLPNFISTKHL